MALWIPGPWSDDHDADWDAYLSRHLPESPHQAAIADTTPRKRTTREAQKDG